MSTQKVSPLRRADRVAVGIFSVLGLAIVAVAIVMAVQRIREFLSSGDVAVPVEFEGALSNIAPGAGATYETEIHTATIKVDGLSTTAVVAGIAQAVVVSVTIAVVVYCLIALSRRAVRGNVFGRGSTARVAIAGAVGLFGYAAATFLGGVVSVEAFAKAGRTMQTMVVMRFDVFPVIIAAFATGLIITVFAVGARLQRETEGLV